MFTGLIEETGTVIAKIRKPDAVELQIKANAVLSGSKIGHSICVDGVCLTVTGLNHSSFKAEVMSATWESTTLKQFRVGRKANLERALSVGDRLGGHVVQGHVNGVGNVKRLVKTGKQFELEVSIPLGCEPEIVPKGSIAINGISLTIQDVKRHSFSTLIIPHTAQETTLGDLRVGSNVNLETDVFLRKSAA